jgi:hypothetical protein
LHLCTPLFEVHTISCITNIHSYYICMYHYLMLVPYPVSFRPISIASVCTTIWCPYHIPCYSGPYWLHLYVPLFNACTSSCIQNLRPILVTSIHATIWCLYQWTGQYCSIYYIDWRKVRNGKLMMLLSVIWIC